MENMKSPIKMSSRLHKVADMITPGLIVADIGTDHGYIPIYQVLTGKAHVAYACDVAEAEGKGFRVAGELTNTDTIMENTFWIGVYPGMTEEKLSYMIKVIHEAVGMEKVYEN